jgi:serine/threonine protein phosphatase PrpC
MLPHTSIPGDPGNTLDDVRKELEAIDRDAPLPPDDGSRVYGVCDPGLRRPHNEDAMASARGMTAGEPWTVLVVCDGVSSSSHAEQASAVASKTACDALAHFARTGDVKHEAGASAVAAAIRAAHIAVCAQGIDSAAGDPPGTTIVVGLVWRRRLTVGWVGDSRAYWIPDDRAGAEPYRLTEDDSWAAGMVAAGLMSEAEAYADARAHAITGWLGADAEEVEPHTIAFTPHVPGVLLICTDGLWNYAEAATDLADLVRFDARQDPLRAARALVAFAVAAGGHDNITVALLPVLPDPAGGYTDTLVDLPVITVPPAEEATAPAPPAPSAAPPLPPLPPHPPLPPR